MFGNNKKEPGKTSNFIASTSTNSLNSLVQGTLVEGTVRSESDIRVDGTIKGKLYCEAKVIIGPSGRIEGEINCQNAVILGGFSGSIHVKELLIVKDSANMEGDVSTNRLEINAGATFNVNCTMGSGKSKLNGHKTSVKPVISAGIKEEKASQLGS